MDGPLDYATLTSKEEQYTAIAAAPSVDELDAMWAAWERIGFSREGLLYAAILERKQELGAVLEQDQVAAIVLANQRRKAGAALPPISGQVNPKTGEG